MERIDHILVVDDDRDIRELIVDYLEKSGYRASGAANGKAMWSVLKNHQIDLIVLDIMMPGEDGLTLCRQLRANPQQDIPVLMLTARTDDSDRILGLEMGADDYLIKPFVARELLARIKAIFRPHPGAAAEPADHRGGQADRLWRLAARHCRSPFAGRQRRHRRPQRGGVSAAAGVSRPSTAGAEPRSAAQSDPGTRRGTV